ncbi:MAG: hypothetical protein WAM66_00080 [Acidobacteriaceae bacterium]
MDRRSFSKVGSAAAIATGAGKAEIEVKGMRYPVRWACHQKLNEDGTLTLYPNGRFDIVNVPCA